MTKRTAVVVGAVLAALVAALVLSLGYAAYLSGAIAFRDTGAAQLLRAQLAGSSQQSHDVLVAGVTPGANGRPYRTDTLVLVHMDPQGHRIWQLWIPPNLVSTIPGHGDRPISEAHLYGGAAGAVQAVKRLTGRPINQYVEFDVAGVRKAVDSVGGVWVDVPSAITDASVGAGTAQGTSGVSAGWQQIDGSQALTLVSASPTPADPDYARLRDEKLVVDALASKMSERPSDLPGIIAAIAPFSQTTMHLSEFFGTGMAMSSAGSAGVYSAVVIGQRQSRYITPDAVALAKLVADIRAERPFDVPSATLTQAATNAEAVVSSKPASRITVTVENGSGLSGAAKQAAGLLQTQGFVVAGTGNANQNVYKQTFVIYKGDPSLANLVAQFLPPGVKIVRSGGLYAFKTDILVIIGKDWDIGKAPVAQIQTQ